MIENNQDRIIGLVTKLNDIGFPKSDGLDDHQIDALEVQLHKEVPATCKSLLRMVNWPGEDVPVNPAVIQHNSPIGEIVFNGFYSALQWSDLTNSSQSDLEWCRELDADDKIVVEGAAKPEIYNGNRIFFSYGNGLYWFMDLDPADGGLSGQVVMLYPMYQEHYIRVVAPDILSFAELIVSHWAGNR